MERQRDDSNSEGERERESEERKSWTLVTFTLFSDTAFFCFVMKL